MSTSLSTSNVHAATMATDSTMTTSVANTTLAAPSMSVSSSRASNMDDMWSADPSRRGSDASSVTSASTPDLTALSAEKLKSSLASVPMAVSASDTGHVRPQPQTTTSAPVSAPRRLKHSTDPLERSFPKPEGDIDVGAALARDPLKWSLGHWKKNARDVAAPASTPADSKKKFDDIKDELRRAQQEMVSKAKR